jgi:phage gp29-like protein
MCRRQASQLIIGSDSGVFAEGSNRSTASVQDSVRKSMTSNDTADLRRTIRTQIFKPLVEANFGKGMPIPDVEFKFDMGMNEISENMERMKRAGWELPVEELNKLTGLKWVKSEGQSPEVLGE